jgi:hypothetical protein
MARPKHLRVGTRTFSFSPIPCYDTESIPLSPRSARNSFLDKTNLFSNIIYNIFKAYKESLGALDDPT